MSAAIVLALARCAIANNPNAAVIQQVRRLIAASEGVQKKRLQDLMDWHDSGRPAPTETVILAAPSQPADDGRKESLPTAKPVAQAEIPTISELQDSANKVFEDLTVVSISAAICGEKAHKDDFAWNHEKVREARLFIKHELLPYLASHPAAEQAAAEGERVQEGSWHHLKLMMQSSAWEGRLQLDDAIANIDAFAAVRRAMPEQAAATERKAFEAWAKAQKQGFMLAHIIDGIYLDDPTQCAWMAWQAARRPVRELTDDSIGALWRESDRCIFKFARALLSKSREPQP